MPIYLYKCGECGKEFQDTQAMMIGSRDIYCKCGNIMFRDYKGEGVGTIEDWEPGYNPGIDYNYTSKADLMSEIKRRGLYPSKHGGGISVGGSKTGLYGDEEFKNLYDYSEPEDHEGLTNEPSII